MRPSIANGIPSVPSTVSSGARQRSTAGTTSAICSSGDPSAASSRIDSATSSSEPRAPAPSRKRTAPSSGGPSGGVSEKRCRSRCASAALPYSAARAGSSSIAAAGQGGEIFLRPPERREGGPAGLVRHRDGQLGAGRERLEEAPLRPGQVLEAVREDRTAVPGSRCPCAAARRQRAGAGHGPRARAGPAPRDRRRREARGHRRAEPARAGRTRARRARPGASRRSPGSVRSDRARSAESGRARAAPRANAGRR